MGTALEMRVHFTEMNPSTYVIVTWNRYQLSRNVGLGAIYFANLLVHGFFGTNFYCFDPPLAGQHGSII